jgi:hypothetical protein
MPEIFNTPYLGKESMSPNIEAPSISFYSPRNPTNDIVLFENDTRIPSGFKFFGACQASWSGTYDHDGSGFSIQHFFGLHGFNCKTASSLE